MRKGWWWLVAGLLATGGLVFAGEDAGAKGTSAEAHKWVDGGALLLDVRTREEFAERHLPGAVNIPVQELDKRMAEVGAKDKPVVIYCRSGRRSAQAATMLQKAGYQKLLDLGGIDNW